MEAATLIALGALVLTAMGGFAAWVIRFGKAESAMEVARASQAEVDAVKGQLAAFKVEVARDYATASMVAAFEMRMAAAFDRLGDRIDRLIESRAEPRG